MSLFLGLHIGAGIITLLAAAAAVTTRWLSLNHRWHVISGQCFFRGMFTIFLTALPLSIVASSLFLFLIAIFSFYLAFSGLRYARRRGGSVPGYDRFAALLMVVVGCAMIVSGSVMLVLGDSNGVTLLAFGGLGSWLGYADWAGYRTGSVRGRERIAAHLRMMLGATIAVITAAVVTNNPFEPAFVLWLLPTLIITPILVYWGHRVRAGS